MSEDMLSLRKWAYDHTNNLEEAQKLFDWITQDEAKLFKSKIQPERTTHLVKWTDEIDSFLRSSFLKNDSMRQVRKNLALMGVKASLYVVKSRCKKLGIVRKISPALAESSQKNILRAREALAEKNKGAYNG